MKTVKSVLLIGLLAVCLPLLSIAAEQDKQQPIQVEADNLEIRDQDNISIYSGNVQLNQGSLQIRADRLVIHFNDAKDLVLMEMTGQPASFKQRDKNDNEMRGEADRLDYHETESLLVLSGNARFSKGGDTIESGLIRVNTNTNNIEAANPEADQRVRVVIEPKNK